MKTRILVILLILALAVPLTAAPPSKMKSTPATSLRIDNTTWINANNILMFVTNHGNFARDLTDMFGQDAGTFYPYTTIEALEDGSQNDSPNYASGLWVAGLVGGETRIVIAEYEDEYVPGPMSGGTFMADVPEFKVYKLYKDSLADNPNQDYLDWPNVLFNASNSDQKAPIKDDGTGTMVPDMIGDQMLWAVFNDADPAQHTADQGETDPLGIEVRQTTFAFDREDPLGNVIFMRLRVYNMGTDQIENCYLSLWADPDLGGAGDDLVGSDSDLSLGYCFNATNNDATYGSTPPCLGYDFFQGPMFDAPGETARMWGQTWADKANMGMTSFNKYINGTDPNNFDEAYNYMQGLAANGDPYVYDGNITLHMHAGDPVAGTGDIDFDPADRRFMLSTGPITFAPGDSTEILAAMIVGRGSDRLGSISVMKYYDQFAQSAYDIDFQLPEPPAAPVVAAASLDGGISLTWTDISETDPGDYDFEGYTVFQGESAAGPWHRVATFDLNNGIGTILDDVMNIETGVLENRGVRYGTDTGVRRYFFTSDDAIMGGSLDNVMTYYYKVEAYSYNPAATPKTLTSATSFVVTPQRPIANIEASTYSGDILTVTHEAGISDGSVTPIVLDPALLTGHTYEVTFKVDPSGTHPMLWDLTDATTSTVLLADQFNQTNDDDYVILDGMIVKVSGPPPGVADWDIPNGARRFTWAGASGFGWEALSGALGWGGPGDWNGFNGLVAPVDPNSLPEVLLKLAPVAQDGTFDPNDEDVSYAYRYIRGPGPPARPEFGPFIIDPNASSYDFQDFELSCPLSAWNMDVDPPQRLAVGYLENNAINGLLDGQYWPGLSSYNNTAGDGPREWLWIFLADYSATPVAEYQLNAIDDPMPIMYWATWNRRQDVAWEAEDEFLIIPSRQNGVLDVYSFVATAPVATSGAGILDDIKVVPNPFYLYGPYDPAVGNHQIKFNNLPAECTINIYNLAGEFVDQIHKDDASTAIATWDGLTDSGLPVASGVYLYVVEARGYGTKIGKFAVFMEVEVLKKY